MAASKRMQGLFIIKSCYLFWLMWMGSQGKTSNLASFGNESNAVVVETLQGSDAQLPCELCALWDQHDMSLVIWYKDDIKSPIYSYDFRSHKSSQAIWANRTIASDRPKYYMKQNPPALVLENVATQDAGRYRCRIDFNRAPTINLIFNLVVITPVEKVAILDKSGKHIKNYKLGPFNEGESVTITCEATGGDPAPKLSWWKDHQLLTSTSVQITKRKVENKLRLDPIRRSHFGKVFTCEANNSVLNQPISSSVKLLINLKPMWVKIRGENRPLSAGHTYELECEVVGAIPPPIITWWKGSSNVTTAVTTISSDGNMTVSVLTFKPVVSDGGKYLSCRGQQTSIPDSGVEDGWKLVIYHVPIVTLELGSTVDFSFIKEGADVYFECNIKSNPWIYQIRWMYNISYGSKEAMNTPAEIYEYIGECRRCYVGLRNLFTLHMKDPGQRKWLGKETLSASKTMGNQVYNNVAEGVLVSNQSLVLQSVSRSNAGTYTCVASNREGDGESNPVYLDVKFSPNCRPGQTTVYGIAKGETAEVACEVEANPPKVSFVWYFNTTYKTGLVPSKHIVVEPLKSVVMYTPLTDKDFGTLICTSYNKVDPQSVPCVFKLIPAGRPEDLTNCSLHNYTATTVSVFCIESYDGGLTQSFMLEVYTESGKLVSSVTSKIPLLHVAGLESGKTYELQAYSYNKKGKSYPVKLRGQTLQSAAKRTAIIPSFFSLKPRYGLYIGIGAAVVVTLVTIIIAISKSSICKKKADNQGEVFHEDPQECSPDGSDDHNPDVVPQVLNGDEFIEEERAFDYLKTAPPRTYPIMTRGTIPNTINFGPENVNMAHSDHGKSLTSAHLTGATLPRTKQPIVYAQLEVSKPPPELYNTLDFRTSRAGIAEALPPRLNATLDRPRMKTERYELYTTAIPRQATPEMRILNDAGRF